MAFGGSWSLIGNECGSWLLKRVFQGSLKEIHGPKKLVYDYAIICTWIILQCSEIHGKLHNRARSLSIELAQLLSLHSVESITEIS